MDSLETPLPRVEKSSLYLCRQKKSIFKHVPSILTALNLSMLLALTQDLLKATFILVDFIFFTDNRTHNSYRV